MHNYVHLNYQDTIHAQDDEVSPNKASKLPEGLTVEQLQQQREKEFQNLYSK
jgi:hypothetical protein